MFGAVQEVGVAECDVSCASRDLLANVVQDDVLRNNEKASFVDRRNRAVRAQVQATATGFNVSRNSGFSVFFKLRVLLQRRKCIALRSSEFQPFEVRLGRSIALKHRLDFKPCFTLQSLGQCDKRGLKFPANARVASVVEQILGVQSRIKTVEADVARRVDLGDTLGYADSESHRGVHRH